MTADKVRRGERSDAGRRRGSSIWGIGGHGSYGARLDREEWGAINRHTDKDQLVPQPALTNAPASLLLDTLLL